MTARAIPAELEPEILEKSRDGWSLRRISQWLEETKELQASYKAVAGVIQRHGPSLAELLKNDLTREFAESLPATVAELKEVNATYRAIAEAGLSPTPPPKLSVALRAAHRREQLLLMKMRLCGIGTPGIRTPSLPLPSAAVPAPEPTPQPAMPPPVAEPTAVEAPVEAAKPVEAPKATEPVKPVDAPKPPARTRPCPCGSGKKYKHCHADIGWPVARANPLAAAA